VRLAPRLAAKVSPADTVFIFARAARAADAPRRAAQAGTRAAGQVRPRRQHGDAPGMKLSSFPRVIVGARISKSGSATPQAGDLQGLSAAVGNSAQGVSVVIDTELPAK